MTASVHLGTVVHCAGPEVEIFDRGGLVVDDQGHVVACGPASLAEKYAGMPVVDHGRSLLVPGFVDAHVHLPQYVFAGLGAKELLPWLETYTFPMEARLADTVFAREVASRFFASLLEHGTTTAAVFVTSSTSATRIAFEAAEKHGNRAIIGKVMMERNALETILEPWEQGLRASEELADEWHGHEGRLFFAVTPRFAITCSEEAMRAAGRLAHQRGLYVQTHLSESVAEVGLVAKLFPHFKKYTDVYDRCGLLTDRTLLAHCIHLGDGEVRRIIDAGSVMVHCPTSNRYLQSGVFPLRRMEEQGALVALGSDVAGGYELSMLHEMREAVEGSKSWNICNRGEARSVLAVDEAFRLATLGGAEALGLSHRVGNFEAGKAADFLVIDDTEINDFAASGLYQAPLERLARVMYRGRWPVARTYIGGTQRFSREALTRPLPRC